MDYSVLYNSVYNNPAKERVDCEDGWLIKSSLITKDEMKACQLTKIKLPPQKIKNKSVLDEPVLDILIFNFIPLDI
jgi:hypothetical protein